HTSFEYSTKTGRLGSRRVRTVSAKFSTNLLLAPWGKLNHGAIPVRLLRSTSVSSATPSSERPKLDWTGRSFHVRTRELLVDIQSMKRSTDIPLRRSRN